MSSQTLKELSTECRFIKLFYGNEADQLEIELNNFIKDNFIKVISVNCNYLPDPDNNPHRTYLLYTLLYTKLLPGDYNKAWLVKNKEFFDNEIFNND